MSFRKRDVRSPSVALLLAAVTGALVAASFPDPGFGALAWVALVPYLLVARALGPVTSALLAGYAGLVATLLSCGWMLTLFRHQLRLTDPVALGLFLGVSLAAALPFALWGGFVPALMSRPRPWLAATLAAAAWVAMEWMRVAVYPRVPWLLLGSSQAGWPPMIQLARVTGVYGISFAIVWSNTALARVWMTLRHANGPRTPRRAWPLVGLCLGAPLATLGLGLATAPPPERGPGLTIAAIAAEIQHHDHWDPAHIPGNMRRYIALSTLGLRQPADLLVWPEAAATFDLRSDTYYLTGVLPLLARHQSHFLTGAPVVEIESGQRRIYNSAVLFDPRGRIVGRYDKQRLLPLSEYQPPLLDALGPLWRPVRRQLTGLEVTAGAPRPPLHIGDVSVQVLMCHEALFPDPRHDPTDARRGLLINLTNDAWFGSTQGRAQHFQQARVRAVETGRPMLRLANGGISAAIDARGRVVDALDVGKEGHLRATLVPTLGITTYQRFGDILPLACLVAVLVEVLLRLRRRITAG